MKSLSTYELSFASRPAKRAAGVFAFAATALLLFSEVRRPALPIGFELANAASAANATAASGLFAARAASAAWSFVALLAVCTFVARTLSPRTALYAFAVFATSPIWFVAERTATGTMRGTAAVLIAFSLLGLAALDGQMHKWMRASSALVALASLAVAEVAWRKSGAFTATAGTFEAPVAALAYGLAPWSPLVPFAIATRPRNAAHLAILIAAVTSAALASLAPPTFAPIAAAFLGLATAAMLASLDRARRVASLLAVSVAALAFLVVHDLGVTPARMIESFVTSASASTGAIAAVAAVAKAASRVGIVLRAATAVTAAIAFVALVLPRRWLPIGRGAAIVIAGSLAGVALRAFAYPKLLARLSPSAVVEAWHAHREAGDAAIAPLGLLGVDAKAVVGGDGRDLQNVQIEPNAQEAAKWLTAAPPSPRRFLALAASPGDLARINADYRAQFHRNVPVLVAGDETTLLLASALRSDETDVSPLDRLVLDAPPVNVRPLDVRFGDPLHVVGWQLTGEDDRALATISHKSRHAHVRIVVQVDDAAPSGLCTFLHIDHAPSRFSDEHRELTYPMDLWRRGDTVVDDYDVTLPAGFTKGMYKMYWGFGRLPCEDDRRLPITSGPSDGHGRVLVGAVEVK